MLSLRRNLRNDSGNIMFTGEIISLTVAMSWTITALLAEYASKKMGSLPHNLIRMVVSLLMLAAILWLTIGTPYPLMADWHTWFWLGLSGFVGYTLGDYCLMQSYIVMNSRFGQLFMTLASPSAAMAAWMLLGQTMRPLAVLGMLITMFGIGMSVLGKGDGARKLNLKMPLKGILFGIGAAMGQGVGLVLSRVGMDRYQSAIAAAGITDISAWSCPEALFPVSFGFIMPFASTMIRCIIGMIGFSAALFLLSKNGKQKLQKAVGNRRAMWCVWGGAVFGPCVGVSLSLMATLYTSAGIAQTIMALTPILILLPSRFIYHQRISVLEVVGAIISVAGVSLFFL